MTDDAIAPATDQLHLTFDELCARCAVEREWIIELVEHGALDPAGATASEWSFAEVSVLRVAKARRLSTDLDINPPGIAMVLDLLDEIDRLRAQLRRAT